MKILRCLAGVFISLSIIITIFFGIKKISDSPLKAENNFSGILSVWQIDCFEGGSGSRKQFLLDVAIKFEKKYSVLVMVVSHSAESAEDSMKKGIYPDVISYGVGVSISNLSELNVNKEFSGGLIGDKQYALPWCRGGYALIVNPKYDKGIDDEIDFLTVSKSQFTLPLMALAYNDIVVKDFEILRPLDAYINFVSGKSKYLLGTQRDIVRLNNRGMEYNCYPLQNYNDLYQFVSISSTEQIKKYYAEKFVEYLLSDNVQNSLSKINMLSAYTNLSYSDSMKDLQNIKEFKTISPFYDKNVIEEISWLSNLAIKGDEQAKIKIKNMIV